MSNSGTLTGSLRALDSIMGRICEQRGYHDAEVKGCYVERQETAHSQIVIGEADLAMMQRLGILRRTFGLVIDTHSFVLNNSDALG